MADLDAVDAELNKVSAVLEATSLAGLLAAAATLGSPSLRDAVVPPVATAVAAEACASQQAVAALQHAQDAAIAAKGLRAAANQPTSPVWGSSLLPAAGRTSVAACAKSLAAAQQCAGQYAVLQHRVLQLPVLQRRWTELCAEARAVEAAAQPASFAPHVRALHASLVQCSAVLRLYGCSRSAVSTADLPAHGSGSGSGSGSVDGMRVSYADADAAVTDARRCVDAVSAALSDVTVGRQVHRRCRGSADRRSRAVLEVARPQLLRYIRRSRGLEPPAASPRSARALSPAAPEPPSPSRALTGARRQQPPPHLGRDTGDSCDDVAAVVSVARAMGQLPLQPPPAPVPAAAPPQLPASAAHSGNGERQPMAPRAHSVASSVASGSSAAARRRLHNSSAPSQSNSKPRVRRSRPKPRSSSALRSRSKPASRSHSYTHAPNARHRGRPVVPWHPAGPTTSLTMAPASTDTATYRVVSPRPSRRGGGGGGGGAAAAAGAAAGAAAAAAAAAAGGGGGRRRQPLLTKAQWQRLEQRRAKALDKAVSRRQRAAAADEYRLRRGWRRPPSAAAVPPAPKPVSPPLCSRSGASASVSAAVCAVTESLGGMASDESRAEESLRVQWVSPPHHM